MLADLRRSVTTFLNERATAPLYVAFVASWAVCNWQIVYVTFFVDASRLPDGVNKLSFVDPYINIYNTAIWPALITPAVVVMLHLASNGAYWLSLKSKKWRMDRKRKIMDAPKVPAARKPGALNREEVDKINGFEVLFAEYAPAKIREEAAPASGFDVTKIVRQYLTAPRDAGTISFKVTNASLLDPLGIEDPTYGVLRQLTVIYRTNHNRVDKVTINEYEIVTADLEHGRIYATNKPFNNFRFRLRAPERV